MENKDLNILLVDVKSATATIRVPIKFLDDLMPGTVALPHGWGHQTSHLSVANKTKGVNVNVLSAADGAENLEKISGMAYLTGIFVEVEKAKKPQAESWSGLEKDVLIDGKFHKMKTFCLVLVSCLIWSCSNKTKALLGTWTNEASGGNQTFIFKKDSTAFWIFYDESRSDTLKLNYKTNFAKVPSNLDLFGFEKEPLQNQVLYGIIEFEKKQTFRFDCEPGENTFKGRSVRPEQFSLQQTQVFNKIKKKL